MRWSDICCRRLSSAIGQSLIVAMILRFCRGGILMEGVAQRQARDAFKGLCTLVECLNVSASIRPVD